MIVVKCKEEKIRMAAYHLVKAFFPGEEITSELCEQPETYVSVFKDGAEICCIGPSENEKFACEREMYRQLKAFAGTDLPWGVLTGVRPTKLASAAINKMSRDEFIRRFNEERLVSFQKAALAWDVAEREQRIIREALGENDRDEKSFSLYIGIPVCPSICSYCSFSSGPLSVWAGRMDDYVDALELELKLTAETIGSRHLTSVYIGGGTPTVLTPAQLGRLMDTIERCFDLENVLEYTFEAGRADTITEGKLEIAKRHRVTRLSVNPQTMQQKTLDLVGRAHSVEQVEEAFALAREMGFTNINMDIIAGLPGETAADMQDTLAKIAALGPESLTVHSLAIKRAARLERQSAGAAETEQMVELAYKAAEAMNLNPYYLYRQKSIAGNFENVGYAREGYEGIYNIMIMEEVQSIIACGAGASSKILLKNEIPNPDRGGKIMTNLLHHSNVKSIPEYIERAGEMAAAKAELLKYD